MMDDFRKFYQARNPFGMTAFDDVQKVQGHVRAYFHDRRKSRDTG